MTQWTASVSGPGSLARDFEGLLDVLPAAVLVGDESNDVATLIFDVDARGYDRAVEAAFHRAHDVIGGQPVTLAVQRSSTVPGREPRWRRWLRR